MSVERVAGSPWNQWPDVHGIGGRMAVESAEIANYLPTQVVADYLANGCSPSFDGVIFKSVQVKNGRNVVLFRQACRVVSLEPREGESIDIDLFTMTEDGKEPEFCVTAGAIDVTEYGLSPNIYPDFLGLDFSTFLSSDSEQDGRKPGLEVDVESMQVHEINWVGFTSKPHRVQRRYPRPRDNDDRF